MRAATPMPPSRPGSALDNSLSQSVPSTCPLSRVAIPQATAVTNTSFFSGPPLCQDRRVDQGNWKVLQPALIYYLHNLVKTQVPNQNPLIKALKFQIHLKYTE